MREWYHQPFHGEMQCGSLACTHEHISFHNLGMGIYDNFPVNVFSCATLGWNPGKMPAVFTFKIF